MLFVATDFDTHDWVLKCEHDKIIGKLYTNGLGFSFLRNDTGSHRESTRVHLYTVPR